METHVKDVIHECTRASDGERIAFGEVVAKLIDVGVERYHADLVRSEKTFYLPNGETETVPNESIAIAPTREFSAQDVALAVKDVQSGAIKYKAFCERVMAAGCVGYIVSMAGRRVVYYGRTGESHVEWFPGAR